MLKFNVHLEQIRKKLLDLSKRNKLINYRRPSKAKNLKIIDEAPEFMYKFLVHNEKSFKFKAIPYPNKMPEYLKLIEEKEDIENNKLTALAMKKREIFYAKGWSAKGVSVLNYAVYPFSSKIFSLLQENRKEKLELTKKLDILDEKINKIESNQNFNIEAQAKELGLLTSNEMVEIELGDKSNFDIHLDEYLQTLHYSDELEKILKSIELQSRSIMQVTGSNMLYLVLGVLEWREVDKPDEVVKSPLITVPVSLKRMAFNSKTNTYDYTLSYTGEIIDTNESLAQKLFNDFKIKLPALTEESSFNNYIKEVKKICLAQNHWTIKREVALDFLQFGKVLMYKDLEHTDKLIKNDVLRDIFLGTSCTSSYAVGEYDIDKELLKQKMPLVLDADSSQHSAMIDVLQGKNVVIEGPPGSGKSQIIANLIALLMNKGKKILFVSEKKVALEVVYQRLEQVGLGDFCMELHSHKTDKVAFLQSLNKRIVGKYGFPYRYEKIEQELSYTKQQLSNYVDTLHLTYGSDNKSIFENIWLREKYLEGEKYFLFKISNAARLKRHDLVHCEEYLHEYEMHHNNYDISNSFWLGFEVSELSFMQSNKVIILMQKLEEPYGAVSKILEDFDIKDVNETLVVKNLEDFIKEFKAIEKTYFPFANVNVFQNLKNKLKVYLQTLLGYIDASEINNLSSSEILDALETSSSLLEQLLEFEGKLTPEVIGFERFVQRAKKSYLELEEIEKRNSKNLHLPMVNHKTTEEIYGIVRTIQDKRDSWFRFLSPTYKKAKKSFASLLKERLPSDRESWTFLLRELNVYTLNRENQLKLRWSLVEKVPLFIKKIQGIYSEIDETLAYYKTIQTSSIEPKFKTLILENKEAINKFNPLIKKRKEIEKIHQALSAYGNIQALFWDEQNTRYSQKVKKLQELEKNKDSLSAWISFQRLLNKLKDLGLKEMMKSAERGEIPVDKLIDTFYFNYYNSLLHEAFLEHSILEKFTRVKQDAMVEKFKELDKQYIEKNQNYIAHKLSKNRLPLSEGEGRVATFTNLKLLNHEIGKKRMHVPIRQLLQRAGEAIHALKPCFMMSPLSVAQYMPIEKSSFDVILIDEASQLRPEESLGVIARAKQVVVVGDPKQMPPSSFFDVIQEETSANKKTVLDDSESILDSFIELYSPIRRLKWHYRSQHESLISFSNKHFYDEELTIFPSTSNKVDESLGVKYTYVADGIYKSGNTFRINKIEAQRVLEQVKYQMEFFPENSLGVGTLNGTQQELIQELVDDAEKEYAYISSYIERWKGNNEAFFVKNLESLQGDERDVILISTTYGKELGEEKVAQRFGPINQENGWRRLNVLITRAKQKMHIFTSMLSSDIKTTNNSSRGIHALKNFLKYLEQREGEVSEVNLEHESSSLFAKSLSTILTEKGYKVVPKVGVSGYHIDLAVVSKKDGSYILAIECDGEEYACANSTSDRERLKVEALKRLGWNHYRVWSMEWYKNREFELTRLLRTIDELEENLISGVSENEKKEEKKEEAYRLTVDELNHISTEISFDNLEALLVKNKLKLELLAKCEKLKLLAFPLSFIWKYSKRLELPKIETLVLIYDNPYNDEFPLEVVYELLERQPAIRTLGIKDNSINSLRLIPLFKLVMKEFSNLERIEFFYQSKNDDFEDYIMMEYDNQENRKIIVTEFKDSSSSSNYVIPSFLENTTTLRTLILPNLNDLAAIELLLRLSPEIKTFYCSWDIVTPEILDMQFEDLKLERNMSYKEDYAILEKEVEEINDPNKQELMESLLLSQELSFPPHKPTLIKLLNSKVKEVRVNALDAFHKYHNDKVDSLEKLNIFLANKSDFYDIEELKTNLSKIGSKLNATIHTRTNLIVLGTNNKIKKGIPLNIPVISIERFNELWRVSSLLETQNSEEELQKEAFVKVEEALSPNAITKFLYSNDTKKVLLALTRITNKNFNQNLPTLLGIFKIHPQDKIRKEALKILTRYETNTSKAVLKISQKRRYLSMTNEEQLKKDFQKMERIKEFDTDAFGKYIAWKHPLALGNYRFIGLDTEEVERFILKQLNRKKVVLIEPLSPRFLKAKKIEELTIPQSSKTLWKMKQLKYLKFNAMGKELFISQELAKLDNLKELYIYAKDIKIGGSSESVELLSIQGCRSFLFDEDVVLKNVKKINFISSNDTFSTNIALLKKSVPNLESIEGGSLFDNTGFMNRYKDEILRAFPNIKFINLESTYQEYIFDGSKTYIVKR